MNKDVIEKMFVLIEFVLLRCEKLVLNNSFNATKHKNIY